MKTGLKSTLLILIGLFVAGWAGLWIVLSEMNDSEFCIHAGSADASSGALFVAAGSPDHAPAEEFIEEEEVEESFRLRNWKTSFSYWDESLVSVPGFFCERKAGKLTGPLLILRI